MQEMNTKHFPDMVKLGDMLWIEGYNSVPQSMRNSGFVKVMNIPSNSGDSREFGEIDSNEYINPKAEGEQSDRGRAQIGYKKIMYAQRISENFGLSYEMRTRGKYPEIVGGLTALGRKPVLTMDLDLSHRITFGTATSYVNRKGQTIDITLGDTLALFSTAHTLTKSSTTYRNRLANNPQLSKGSLEAMQTMCVENCFNNLGEKMSGSYSILWVTDDPATIHMAEELTKSTASIEGINSGVFNVHKGGFQVVILPRVATDALGGIDSTKKKYWGLASPIHSSFYLGIWEEPRFMGGSAATEDLQTDDWEFRTRAGYGIAIVSARGIAFSSGDGTA